MTVLSTEPPVHAVKRQHVCIPCRDVAEPFDEYIGISQELERFRYVWRVESFGKDLTSHTWPARHPCSSVPIPADELRSQPRDSESRSASESSRSSEGAGSATVVGPVAK